MELKLKRLTKTAKYTAGRFFIDSKDFCYTLEDTDRNLDSKMALADIAKLKVKNLTAIPRGKYEVVLNFSNRFQKYMPLLLNVPGFEGVRIHSGNKAEDTEGCILLGYEDSSDGFMGMSRDAVGDFMDKFQAALKVGKVWITIE